MPKVSLQNETQLMQRITQQEEAALSELYDKCSGPVYSLALRVLGRADQAEEVMQDVFLKVWEKPSQWDSERGKLISWLLTMTRYAAIDRLRAEKRRPAEPLEHHHPTEEGTFTEKVAVGELLDTLPAEQRQVIELACFHGMSHTEIAEHTTTPLGTVKTRLRLGMEKLRDVWKASNG